MRLPASKIWTIPLFRLYRGNDVAVDFSIIFDAAKPGIPTHIFFAYWHLLLSCGIIAPGKRNFCEESMKFDWEQIFAKGENDRIEFKKSLLKKNSEVFMWLSPIKN